MQQDMSAQGGPKGLIPVVDFGMFLNGTKEEREYIAKEIDDAFRNLGFVYLRNHGVMQEMVEKCFQWVNSPIHLQVYYSTADESQRPPDTDIRTVKEILRLVVRDEDACSSPTWRFVTLWW